MPDNRQRDNDWEGRNNNPPGERDEEICALWPTRVEGMWSGELSTGLKVVMFANDRNSRGPAFRIMRARNQEPYKPREGEAPRREPARPTREARTVPHGERPAERAPYRPQHYRRPEPDDYGPPHDDDDDPGDI